jgi:hypothetical protein
MTDTGLTVFGIQASELPEVLGRWGVSKPVTEGFCTKLKNSLLISTFGVVSEKTDFKLLSQYHRPWLKAPYHNRIPASMSDLSKSLFTELRYKPGQIEDEYLITWELWITNYEGTSVSWDMELRIRLRNKVTADETERNVLGKVQNYVYPSLHSYSWRIDCWKDNEIRSFYDWESALEAFSWE